MHERPLPTATLSEYLEQLDVAVQHLPHGLASDLTAEIAAQLSGLDEEALAHHIQALGPPEAVARAALDAAELAPPADPFGDQAARAQPKAPTPLSETRGYAIVGLVLLGIGGVVIPGIGWGIGAALVATSKFWRRREKLIAVLAAPVALAVAGLVAWATSAALNLGGAGTAASTAATVNPLLPNAFDAMTASFAFALLIAAPLSALWLLLRLRGRTSPEDTLRV